MLAQTSLGTKQEAQDHHHADMPSQTHDHAGLAKINATHFDSHIADRNSMAGAFTAMYTAMEQEVISRRDWYGLPTAIKKKGTGPPVRLLDYACGAGHGTRTLLPWIDEAVGIDVSGGSVEAYNNWARERATPDTKMTGYVGNLMVDGDCRDISLFGFDLIIMNMALHHVHDPCMLIRRLVQRLKRGSGHLVIIDWNENGCTLPMVLQAAKHGAMKVGFEDGEIREYFQQAGCDDVDVQLITSHVESGQAFIAKGRREA